MTDLHLAQDSPLWPYCREFETFARASGLGGTDVAAIVGLHPYKTALEVYLDKRGMGKEFIPSEAVLMGTKLEPVVADLYTERRALDFEGRDLRLASPGTLVHPDHEWAFGSPDRFVVDAEGRWLWGLEIKTTGFRSEKRWGESGSNKFPQEYLIQCVWYMYVSRALCTLQGWDPIAYWDLAVLITGQEYRQFRIYHDPELEQNLVAEVAAFWDDAIENDNPPEIGPRDGPNLPRLWPKDDGYMIDADDTQEGLAADLHRLTYEIAAMEDQRDEVRRALKVMIGEASGIEGQDFRITWKQRKAPKKVYYKGLVKSLNPPPELIETFTTYGNPQRPFLAKFDQPYEPENEGAET